MAAAAGGGIPLSAIIAVHFSNAKIEEKRHQLIVEAMTFTAELEQYLQSREMIAKTVGAIFDSGELSQPHLFRLIGTKVLALSP